MLPLTSGFRRSITKHNVDITVLADWAEACALFSEESRVTGASFIDMLIEEEVYDDQDFCWEIIDEGFLELQRRSRMNPAYPVLTRDRAIERLVASWHDAPAHSFLLLLTLAQRYDNWTRVMPVEYNLQGDLFEQLTRESLVSQFPEWIIHPTGWTKTNPAHLQELVTDIAGRLGEIQGDVKAWTGPEAKEAGLDLLCYRPFPDGHVGVPLLMLQCASGAWDEPGKVKTPDIDIWTKIVVFASRPKRAFATHFSFTRHKFRKVAGQVDGILLDRHRLLGAKPENEWVSNELRQRLIEWLDVRVQRLSELSN